MIVLQETLNDYLQTTINTSNVSAMLNVIKFNDTDNGQTETKVGQTLFYIFMLLLHLMLFAYLYFN